MLYSTKVIKELESLDPKLKEVFNVVLEEIERSIKEVVRRTDFLELKDIVAELTKRTAELAEAQLRSEERLTRLETAVIGLAEALSKAEERLARLEVTVLELAEAQKKAEERLTRLEKTVQDLAEAQKKAEERLTRLEETVHELAEAQKKAEERLTKLEKTVHELAEAQKKAEERLTRLEVTVEELAQAQKRTENRLNELAEAQKKTEQELKDLIREHKKTREILGSLTDTVGHSLEDRIMPYIATFALKEYGVKVSLVERRNVIYPDGSYDEVNIYAEGKRDGQKVYLVGECKAKPGKKDIERFSSLIKRLSSHLKDPIHPFVVGYTYSPEVEKYIKERYPEIKMVKSYEFELKYSRRKL